MYPAEELRGSAGLSHRQQRQTPLAGLGHRNPVPLGGATAVFSKRGFAGCTVENILVAAGVSRRTFYQLFANKEEVLDELFELATSWLIEQIRDSVEAEDDLATKLARGIDAFLALQELAGPLLPELLGEAQRPESRLADRHERTRDTITSLFAEGVNARHGYEVDPLVLGQAERSELRDQDRAAAVPQLLGPASVQGRHRSASIWAHPPGRRADSTWQRHSSVVEGDRLAVASPPPGVELGSCEKARSDRRSSVECCITCRFR